MISLHELFRVEDESEADPRINILESLKIPLELRGITVSLHEIFNKTSFANQHKKHQLNELVM